MKNNCLSFTDLMRYHQNCEKKGKIGFGIEMKEELKKKNK